MEPRGRSRGQEDHGISAAPGGRTACERRVIVGQKFLRLPQDLPREWQYLLRWTYA
jgi:hypothetical protein